MDSPTIIILGHSRSGKTTVANWIAQALGGKAANVSDVLVAHWGCLTAKDVQWAKSIPLVGAQVRRRLSQFGRGAELAYKMPESQWGQLFCGEWNIGASDYERFIEFIQPDAAAFASGVAFGNELIAEGFSPSPAVIIDCLARDHCAIAGVRTMDELRACVEHGIGTHFIWCEGGERIHDGTIEDYSSVLTLTQSLYLQWKPHPGTRKAKLLKWHLREFLTGKDTADVSA